MTATARSTPTMEVRVEVDESLFGDRMSEMVAFQNEVQERLATVLSITPKVKLIEPGSIERTSGKALRVVDRRSF